MHTNRVYGLDILKAICAFLVIAIHAPFQGIAGTCAAAVARIAVPIFFMITGYFYTQTRQNGKEIRQIRKMFKLFLIANLMGFLWVLLVKTLSGGQPAKFVARYFDRRLMHIFLFCNDSPSMGHLWYLGAILYALGVVYLLYRLFPKSAETILFIAAPVLLAVNMVFGNYGGLLFDRAFPLHLVRNFLFAGIPYFSIGLFLQKYKDSVAKLGGHRWILAFSILLFACTSVAEEFLRLRFHSLSTNDHYISTLFLSVSVFILFTDRFWDNKIPILFHIGRECSACIYIIHPMVIYVANFVLRRTPIYGIYRFGEPIIIFAITALVSLCFNRIRHK